MYTIVMTENKNLIHTIKSRIICGETNSDTIRFLVPATYEGKDLSTFVAAIKFKLPTGDNVCEVLTAQEELYNGYLDYRLPVTSKLTVVVGKVDFCLEFIKSEDEDPIKLFSKYSSLLIVPHNTYRCDGQVADIRIDRLERIISDIQTTKADDIEVIGDEIWLVSDGKPIGDPIEVSSTSDLEWKTI